MIDRVRDSIAPVLDSSTQSPPRAAAPVSLVDAATSAPVAAANALMKAWPALPEATLQP